MSEQQVVGVTSGNAAKKDQKHVKVQLPEALFKRLLHTHAIEVQNKSAIVIEDEQVELPRQIVGQYLNGYIFARYMIVLKLLVKQKQNQDLNFNISNLMTCTETTEQPLQNWIVISKELDKTGITIDEEVMQLLASDDQESVNRLFMRVERYMKILCGQQFLNFEGAENVFESIEYQQQRSQLLQHDMQEYFVQKTEEFSINFQNSDSKPPVEVSVDFKSNNDKDKLGTHFDKNILDQSPIPIQSQHSLKVVLKHTEAEDVMISSINDSFETISAKMSRKISIDQMPRSEFINKLVREVTEGVDIVTIQTDRPLGLCQNSLEFLLVTLSRSFELTPIQAASLLTNNNQYLVTACVKGVKGGFFQTLINWYHELSDNVVVLTELLQAELQTFKDFRSIQKVLAIIASGLYSSNKDVAQNTFQLLIDCFQLFDEVPELQEVALSWFLSSEEGGLKRSVHAIQQHQECTQHFVSFCNVVCIVHEQTSVMFKDELQNHCRSTFEYLQIISQIIGYLKVTKEDQVIDSGLIDYWLDISAREAENDGVHTVEERIAALSLMTEVWIHFTDHVGEVDDRANSIIFMLKRACREQSRLIKISTASFLFKLLDNFSKTRNQSAPIIYKTLVFNIVESPGDLTIRELYFQNFKEIFWNQQSIPIALLIEPLLKQIQTQLGVTYHLKTVDYEFFRFIADHPKLTQDLALQLMEILSKISISEVVHATALVPTYFRILERYSFEQNVLVAVQSFIQLCLQSVLEIEQQGLKEPNQNHKFSRQGRAPQRYNHSISAKALPGVSITMTDQDTLLQYRKQLIYAILQRLQKVQSEQIQKDLAEQLRSMQQKMISLQLTQSSTGFIDQLLQFYGTSEILVHKPETFIDSEFVSNEKAPLIQSYEDNERVLKQGDTDTLVPFVLQQRQENAAKRKVLQDIERIKNQKLIKEDQKKKEEERQNKHQERMKSNLRKQIERRRIELGVVGSKDSSVPKAILQQTNETPEPLQVLKQNFLHAGVQWFDLEDEEECDKQAVSIFIKKTNKLWRNLFLKYSNVGFKVIPLHERGSFEGLKQSQETISITDITKMLKDHNAYPSLINKEDLATLFRIINVKTAQPSLMTLDFSRFQTFIIQTALNIYTRKSQTTTMAPVDKLKQLYNHFEQATKSKGLSALFYEDQETNASNSNHEFINALTQKLKEDPSYPVPEGFYKVKEKNQVLSYKISEQTLSFIGESRLVVIPLIDELLNTLFGIHFIEPFCQFEEQIKIKPQMSKLPPKPESSKFLLKQNSDLPQNSYVRPKKLIPIIQVSEVPAPSTNLINQVQKSSRSEDKDMIFVVAKVMETIIQSCFSSVSAEPELKNEAMKAVKDRELQLAILEREREAKRRERDAKIKVDLERLKVERAEKEEKMMAERKEKERQDKITEKKRYDAARQSLQKVIEEARTRDEKKQQDAPESQKQAAQVRAVSKPPTKEQIQKQKQIQKELMQKLSEQNSQLQKKEEEAKQKEVELREAIKRKSEQQLAQNRQQRQKDAQFQIQLNEFLESEAVLTIFSKYERFLEHMFKFYCMQGKIDISVNIQHKSNNMEIKEFAKFGYQTKVVPVLLTSDEMLTIFRVAEKQQSQSVETLFKNRTSEQQNTIPHLISYATFKSTLARICIFAHEKLEGQASEGVEKSAANKSESEQSRKMSQDRVKEIINKREVDKKAMQAQILLEMRAEFETKMVKQKSVLSKSPQKSTKRLAQSQSEASLTRGSSKANSSNDQGIQEEEFQKWLKQQDNIGNGLLKRLEQKVSQSTELPKSQSGQNLFNQKQSKVQKQIDLIDKMGKIDIRDHRVVQKEMDINFLSAATIEKLLKFIGLLPGELSINEMDGILNSQRIEIQGQKPQQSKLKRLMLPQISMGTINEQEDERVIQQQMKPQRQDFNDAPILERRNSGYNQSAPFHKSAGEENRESNQPGEDTEDAQFYDPVDKSQEVQRLRASKQQDHKGPEEKAAVTPKQRYEPLQEQTSVSPQRDASELVRQATIKGQEQKLNEKTAN